jgi:hypothetical protein
MNHPILPPRLRAAIVATDLVLKLLLKRGALIAAANWQTVLIQFAAQTTFHVLLAVPVIGAAILVAVLLGADLANLLQGSLREILATISSALMSEPLALLAFTAAFTIVLLGGSVFMFLVKGGTVEVLVAGNEAAGPIEREPITVDSLRPAAQFTLARFMAGCGRLFPSYLALGLLLILAYILSAAGYIAFVVLGYRVAAERALIVGWTLVAALAAGVLVVWITLINLLYLLLQIAIAFGAPGLTAAFRSVVRIARAELRELAGIFMVVLAMVIAALLVSALAWSGVGLIAFVPLVGLAVFPLQIAALLVRGIVFEYIGLTALGAYVTLFKRHAEEFRRADELEPLRPRAGLVDASG